MHRRIFFLTLVFAGAVALACHDSSITGVSSGQGELSMSLKDSPFPFDSVSAVNVFITRIDAKFEHDEQADDDDNDNDDSVMVASDTGAKSWWWHLLGLGSRHHGFTTIATPDTTFNLLELRNGVTAFLGTVVVDTGRLEDLRLVIDPAKSSIVLKDGTKLSGSANPFGRYPPGAMIVVRVKLEDGIVVRSRARTHVTIDFALDQSFVLMGTSIRTHGFLFMPGVSARHDD